MTRQMVVWMRALTSWRPCLLVAEESLLEIHLAGHIEDIGRGLGVQPALLILLTFSVTQLTLKGGGLVLFGL